MGLSMLCYQKLAFVCFAIGNGSSPIYQDESAMKVRWVKQRLHKELDDVREEEDNIGDGLALDFEVDSDSVVHVIQPKGYHHHCPCTLLGLV
jgi:hypothetical protein